MKMWSNQVLALFFAACASSPDVSAFAPLPQSHQIASPNLGLTVPSPALFAPSSNASVRRFMVNQSSKYVPNDDEDEEDDDDDEEEEDSLYEQFASSEFTSKGEITPAQFQSKPVDWGGEYDTLRSRITDTQSGNATPSRALFRTMTAETPNEAIMNFVSSATPEVVSAMSSAVTSLLGGLANPGAGVDTIVKANGEKLGSLCFSLQMTGYMFRNAEYVLAIRDLMGVSGGATLDDYKFAFDKLDKDGSGYIESVEVEALLSDVYGEETPAFEVDTFLQFFDANNDGRISWEEFERGLGVVADKTVSKKRLQNGLNNALPPSLSGDDEEEDNDEETDSRQPTVSGKIQIEMKNGKVIEVEAKEYIEELKREAEALKSALSRERAGGQKQQQQQPQQQIGSIGAPPSPSDDIGGISGYIASLQGDMKSLTEGISSDVMEAMQMLVNFVLDGGNSGRGKDRKSDNQTEMEIPGSALQQLALWQLVLGYRLREAEANGEYRKMLE